MAIYIYSVEVKPFKHKEGDFGFQSEMWNMSVLTLFYGCFYFVLSNSEANYKSEYSHLEKSLKYT